MESTQGKNVTTVEAMNSADTWADSAMHERNPLAGVALPGVGGMGRGVEPAAWDEVRAAVVQPKAVKEEEFPVRHRTSGTAWIAHRCGPISPA